MKRLLFPILLTLGLPAPGAGKPMDLPPPAVVNVDFQTHIRPILQRSCARCHTLEKPKGNLSMNTRGGFLAGGKSGPAVVEGQSGKSLLVQLVAGHDPDRPMPAEGDRLRPEQIGLLRAWIDQGLAWPEGFVLGAVRTVPLQLRQVVVPPPAPGGGLTNPIDLILQDYFQAQGVAPAPPADDRVLARRLWLDLTGLLPPAGELEAFLTDGGQPAQPRREKLVERLLADRRAYAEHWLTFWSDALRNDYSGTGYIDGGRLQITAWLYESLYKNMPYDQFVRELVNPSQASEGFLAGIRWRGVVNASQRPEMQAAQNIAQVFLGTNLKCASCHDSFVNDWKLADAYGLAAIFAQEPLELHRCDKPTGTMAQVRFIYPQLGQIPAQATRPQRLEALATLLTSPENGRLARTVVNRLWAWCFGRGIVDPVDDMDGTPFSADLLDFLAAHLQGNGYDLKATLRLICTSGAYQSRSIGPDPGRKTFVFQGPLVKRMNAEQFLDSLALVNGVWPGVSEQMRKTDGRGQGGQWDVVQRLAALNPGPQGAPGPVRAALLDMDDLARALGRPNREQVVTRRDSPATTLQALALANGPALARMLKEGATRWMAQEAQDPKALARAIYLRSLGRMPTDQELDVAVEVIGAPPQAEGVEDFLWALVMLPEFQLIY